jgi:cell division protein FtsB
MRSKSSARGVLLAVACLSAFEAGCNTSGGMIGMAPDGSSTASHPGSTSSVQSTDAASAVESGNFRPLITRQGVEGCMAISEKDVPTNYVETVLLGTAFWTVLLGAAGAALGAVVTGGQGNGAAAGAIVGGALGAGVGADSGVRTAEQKENFALQLARYDCQIQAAQMENDSLKGAGDRLRTSVDTLTAQLDQLEDDYANKRLTRAQAQKELNDIDDASASLKHRIVAMKDGTDKFQQYSSSTEDLAKGTDLAIDQARVASLDGQIAEMKARNDDLEHEYTLLAERRKALVLQ